MKSEEITKWVLKWTDWISDRLSPAERIAFEKELENPNSKVWQALNELHEAGNGILGPLGKPALGEPDTRAHLKRPVQSLEKRKSLKGSASSVVSLDTLDIGYSDFGQLLFDEGVRVSRDDPSLSNELAKLERALDSAAGGSTSPNARKALINSVQTVEGLIQNNRDAAIAYNNEADALNDTSADSFSMHNVDRKRHLEDATKRDKVANFLTENALPLFKALAVTAKETDERVLKQRTDR